MCRSLVSIDWRGHLYDCDFNQMLGLPLARGGRARGRTSPTCSAATSRATRSWCATTATAAPRGRARAAAGRSRERARPDRCRSPRRGRAAPARFPIAIRRASSTASRSSSRRPLYVVGGLYGNVEALDALEALAAREDSPVTLVFNGDFHWFDVDARRFRAGRARVLAHQGDPRQRRDRDRARRRGGRLRLRLSRRRERRRRVALQRDPRAAARDRARQWRRARAPRGVADAPHRARGRRAHRDRPWRCGLARRMGFRPRPPRRSAPRALGGVGVPRCARGRLREHPHLPAGAARVRRRAWSPTTARPACRTSPRRASACSRASRRARSPGPRGSAASSAPAPSSRRCASTTTTRRWTRRFLRSWPAGSAAHDFSYFRRIADGPRFGRARKRGAAHEQRQAARPRA